MIDVIILAAGQGSRMRSTKPKVLHEIGGKPMLAHVVDAAMSLADVKLHIVVGHGADAVKAALKQPCDIVEQKEQLGTAHAVLQALPNLSPNSQVLILYADVPLIPGNITAYA
jgi:bifunctional UDP-N-acetylglucosamine pyrophosphorylase/glucosamine-1-phosphate N-acetyltransferase